MTAVRVSETLVVPVRDRELEVRRAERGALASWAEARQWWRVAAIVGIGAVALLARIWDLDALGFNSDEAVYAGQAASLAGNPVYSDMFPAFRAHPLLFQILLSPFYRSGEVDVAGRFVVACFGVATVFVVYLLGARLYGRRVGLVAALILAVMPYHVVVTRQVLLDGPMVLFASLTLYCLVRFLESERTAWFVAAGGMLGITGLTKESSLVLAGAVYAFLALTRRVRRPVRLSLLALVVAGTIVVAHPISLALAGHTSTGRGYLVWQLFRRPNHSAGFYLETVPIAVGLLVVAFALGGLWWLRRGWSWRETLLLCWVGTPILFFQLWPVKGFQYLLPVVTPTVILAARGLLSIPLPRRLSTPRVAMRSRLVAVAIVVVSLVAPTWRAVSHQDATTFLAGSGGVPAGREVGRWLAENTPPGSVVLTLGPSMANIIQYYGHRRSYGLSVSPNPLHRNPTYTPLPNPDRALRQNELHYIVWDAYSASRSSFFSERLMTLVRRYHGRVLHTEYVQGRDADGNPTRISVIVVYEVRP